MPIKFHRRVSARCVRVSVIHTIHTQYALLYYACQSRNISFRQQQQQNGLYRTYCVGTMAYLDLWASILLLIFFFCFVCFVQRAIHGAAEPDKKCFAKYLSQ